MKFTDLFVKRPVLASALSILIFLIGLFSFFKLPLRMFPAVEMPTISIQTNYNGASAQVVQETITNIIQNALSGIQGVSYIESSSSMGSSEVDVYLQAGTNSDLALTNIMSKVSSISDKLPSDADKPNISKQAEENKAAIIAFTDDELSNVQIGDFLQRAIKPKLEAIDGVEQAQVAMSGLTMHVSLDPEKMAAFNVSVQDITQALKSENLQAAAGSTEGESTQFNIVTNTNLKSANAFNNLVIKNVGGKLIRLQDVASAKLEATDDTHSIYYDGKKANVVFVTSLPSANPLSIGEEIKKELPMIQSQLPAGMQAHIVMNSADYIQSSIDEVVQSIIEGILIVIAIIYLCLGSLRAIAIPVVTIPLSLIGVCFFMLLMGYSINLLTLLAMVLGIGLVVDDAIVVVENIFRHIEEGIAPLNAAIQGARELATPIIAMTITLAAVFAPIGFMGGVTGQLFSEFAFTLAGSVIISGVIALTLSPMMCGQLLNKNLASGKMVKIADKTFNYLRDLYHKALHFLLQHKKIIVAVWIIILLSVAYLYKHTPKEMSPTEDYGFMMAIGDAPKNASPDFVSQYSRELNGVYQKLPGISHYVYINGVPDSNEVISFSRFVDWKKRMSVMKIQPILQQALNQIPGLKFQAIVPSILPGSRNLPIGFVITSASGDYQNLYTESQRLMAAAEKSGLFLFVTSDLDYEQPQLEININRNAAATLGISMQEVADTLNSLTGQGKVQTFSLDGQSYDVIPQAARQYRLNPDALGQANVKTASGQFVPLSSIMSMKTVTAPTALNQFNKFNSVTLAGLPAPGHTISQCLNFFVSQAQGQLPTGMSYTYSGESKQFLEEGTKMLITFVLAVIVIFLVLAIQFESYRDPLIILLGSVPMSLFGALIFLRMGAATINIYSELGLLTLVGLVSKHGILITKFANELQIEKGMSRAAAVIEAAKVRFRPIIMTTAAMVCSSIPLLTVGGPGSEGRFAIGVVIASGLAIGTLFTLFVVPALYTLIAKNRNKL